jgi:archaetidylinositol phosphate synthase
VGIAERAERLFIILGGAFIGYFTNPQLVMTLAILLIVVLGYITVLQRIYHSWKELKNL